MASLLREGLPSPLMRRHVRLSPAEGRKQVCSQPGSKALGCPAFNAWMSQEHRLWGSRVLVLEWKASTRWTLPEHSLLRDRCLQYTWPLCQYQPRCCDHPVASAPPRLEGFPIYMALGHIAVIFLFLPPRNYKGGWY